MPIIDFRARPTTKEFEYLQVSPWAVDEFQRMGFQSKPLGTLEDFIAELDSAGVTKSVCPGRDSESTIGCKVPNDYIASMVQQYPDRIIGFAGVDPLKGKEAVEEVERSIKELQLSGVALDPCFAYMSPNDQRLYPIYEKCIELNVPVILTVGPLPVKPLLLKHGSPMPVDEVATDLPELDIICSHGGWPFTLEMIAIAMRHDNVYFENSGYHFMPGAEHIVQAANTIIPDKVLFASAYPGGGGSTLKEEVEWFKNLSFKDEVLQKVLYDNAVRVLKL